MRSSTKRIKSNKHMLAEENSMKVSYIEKQNSGCQESSYEFLEIRKLKNLLSNLPILVPSDRLHKQIIRKAHDINKVQRRKPKAINILRQSQRFSIYFVLVALVLIISLGINSKLTVKDFDKEPIQNNGNVEYMPIENDENKQAKEKQDYLDSLPIEQDKSPIRGTWLWLIIVAVLIVICPLLTLVIKRVSMGKKDK